MIFMAGIIVYGVSDVSIWFDWSVFKRVFNLMLWITISMLSYFTFLWFTGLRLRNITSQE